MLQRSADLKGFVQNLGSHESYLTESEWAEFKMMVEVNWRSWTTIWLLLVAPPCNHAKSFYCGKRLSWQLFG